MNNTITIKSDKNNHKSFAKQVFINDLPLFEFRIIPNKQIICDIFEYNYSHSELSHIKQIILEIINQLCNNKTLTEIQQL